MKYRITVEEVNEGSDKKYPTHEEIYKQTVEDLDVDAVIRAVNDKHQPQGRIVRDTATPNI